MPELSEAYDRAVAGAPLENIHIGRGSTRVGGMLEAEPVFGSLYKGEALHAAARVIGGPFKLSCFHARSLHAHWFVEGFAPDGSGRNERSCREEIQTKSVKIIL
ncbi:MAG TPA: hypothetical protein VNA17_07490 [Pyrinomonadaceae bacterium]|nr:hypothetical protein [Pyrinomonadaceae bacterium]